MSGPQTTPVKFTPVFKRRVKKSFYETEKQLGKLTEGWEIAIWKQKQWRYFVNHPFRYTTWVDPRTQKTRKVDIATIKKGELPYGWDEAFDESVGVFYVDHNTRVTYLLPPWDSRVKEQVQEISGYVEEAASRAATLRKTSTKQQTQTEILQLESKKKQLEEELKAIRAKRYTADDIPTGEISRNPALFRKRLEILVKLKEQLEMESMSSTSEEDEESENERMMKALHNRLDNENQGRSQLLMKMNRVQRLVNEQSDEEEFEDSLAAEFEELKGPIPRDIAGFRKRLEMVTKIKDLLEHESMSSSSDSTESESEIMHRINQKLEDESENRRRLIGRVADLQELMENYLHAESSGEEEEMPALEEQPVMVHTPPVPTPPPTPPVKTGPTDEEIRAKMNEELGLLKERLEKRAEVETEQLGKTPVWLKQIRQVAESSKTLRVKITKDQRNDPDLLSFREKMLFYTSGQVEKK